MLLDTLLEAVIGFLIRLPFAFCKWAWSQDFPDPAEGPKRTESIRVARQSSPSPLWNREIDGSQAQLGRIGRVAPVALTTSAILPRTRMGVPTNDTLT